MELVSSWPIPVHAASQFCLSHILCNTETACMSSTLTCGVAVLCAAMHQTPVLPSLAAARQEAEMVMF